MEEDLSCVHYNIALGAATELLSVVALAPQTQQLQTAFRTLLRLFEIVKLY
jgi:hypothetical protein